MRTFVLLLTLAFCGCVVPPKSDVSPVLGVSESAVSGKWIGLYASGYGAYALDLTADKRGRFAFVEGDDVVKTYSIRSWTLSGRRIECLARPDGTAPPITIIVDAFGSIMTLRLRAGDLQRQVDLYRADSTLPRMERVLEALRQ